MANELLLEAAAELDRLGAEPFAGDAAGLVMTLEIAGLAAKLRQVVRWLDRPPADACRCHAEPAATVKVETSAAEKPRSLKKAEAAQLLGISESTLNRIVGKGELHPMKRGRVVRFDRIEIEQLLERARSEENVHA